MGDPIVVDLAEQPPVVVPLDQESAQIADLGMDAPQPAWWKALESIEAGEVDPEFVRGVVSDELAERLSSGGSIHHGEGEPPAFIRGARVGDVYIDTLTGDLYTLGG